MAASKNKNCQNARLSVTVERVIYCIYILICLKMRDVFFPHIVYTHDIPRTRTSLEPYMLSTQILIYASKLKTFFGSKDCFSQLQRPLASCIKVPHVQIY